MALIQPITAQETQYVYSLAILQMHTTDQGEARHRQAAAQFLDAKRTLVAAGEKAYGERNGGLVEFADVLAVQEPKPQGFLDFVEKQKAAAVKRKADEADVKRDKDDTLVIEKQDAHENHKEIEGELANVVQPKRQVLVQDPDVAKVASKKRTLKKETDRG